MTGYTVHTGASKKFVAGWDRVFSASNSGTTPPEPKPKSAKKKASGGKKKTR